MDTKLGHKNHLDGSDKISQLAIQKDTSVNGLIDCLSIQKVVEILYGIPKYGEKHKETIPTLDKLKVEKYLQQNLPDKVTRDERKNELVSRQQTVKSMIQESFALGETLKMSDLEMIFKIDCIYKIGLHQLINKYSEQIDRYFHGHITHNKNMMKLSSILEDNKDGLHNPYSAQEYTGKNTMAHIKEALGIPAFENISNRLHNQLMDHTTCLDPHSVPKNDYYIMDKIYRKNPVDLIRAHINETMIRFLIEYIVRKNWKKIQKKYGDKHSTLHQARIYKSNKIDDVKKGTDYVVCVEIRHGSGTTYKPILIDLKFKDNTPITLTHIHQEGKTQPYAKTGKYLLLQNGNARSIIGTIDSFTNTINDKLTFESHYDASESIIINNFLEKIWGLFEQLNNEMTHYSINEENLATYLQANKHMEDKLTQAYENGGMDTKKGCLEVVKELKLSLIDTYRGTNIEFNLGNNQTANRKELHIGRLVMNDLFTIAFDSISNYGYINTSDKIIEQQLDALISAKGKPIESQIDHIILDKAS